MVNLFWLSLALATQGNLSLPIFPPPRQAEVLGSSWQLQLPIRVEAPETLQRPAELLRKELRSLFGENAVSEKGKTVITIRHFQCKYRAKLSACKYLQTIIWSPLQTPSLLFNGHSACVVVSVQRCLACVASSGALAGSERLRSHVPSPLGSPRQTFLQHTN